MRKFFTLIELIVVIAVLGILAAIIIPNISSFQEEANDTAIQSNVRNLQTSVDMYGLDNYGAVPTTEQPTEKVPEPIDFTQIYPDYTRDLPETEGVKYWIDFNGKVWASTVDAPTGVEYDTVNLKWNGVENAAYYNVFKTTNDVTSSVDKKKMVFIKKVEDSSTAISIPMPSLNTGEEYLVNAVDKNKFESAPVGTGYTGYENNIPTAVISMTPNSSIKENTSISWNYNGSTDPDGDSISKAEWQVDGNPVVSPPATFSVGSHTVKLRVQDDRGNWSSWVTKSFNVQQNNSLVEGVSNFQHTYVANGTYGIQKVKYYELQDLGDRYRMYWPVIYIENGSFSSSSFPNLNGYWHGLHSGCGNSNGIATGRSVSTAIGKTFIAVNSNCSTYYPTGASFADGRNLYMNNSSGTPTGVWNTYQPDPMTGNGNNLEWIEFYK